MKEAGAHTHNTNTLKNLSGQNITNTQDMSGDKTGQASMQADIGLLNRNSAIVSGRFSKGDNINYAALGNTGTPGSKLKIDLSHTHNFEHYHTTDNKGTHTHTINSNGGIESRPNNFTFKIWVRIA